jgi:hypothetical protein
MVTIFACTASAARLTIGWEDLVIRTGRRERQRERETERGGGLRSICSGRMEEIEFHGVIDNS